ncbi:MAG TPA: hypothetical protein VD788_04260, partial [Candidatus Polarisedimenticolaceae bacterium]|nr:hypothetical protein [Candidatus Polarisedimenticolaceae bacterium]
MSREPFNIGSRFRGARDREARRLGTKKVVEGVPLAKLIRRRLVDRPEIVMVAAPRSIHAEKFRRLKTTLTNLPDGRPQVMLVSSAVPKDGKSTISINLGLAFAADPEVKTLLIDADLRRGSVSRFV